jgi:hypothetical protein
MAAPPLDGTSSTLDVGMAPSLPVAALCGFTLPVLRFAFGLRIPSIAFPPALPIVLPSLGLNCSLDNPIDVTSGVPAGGGRTPNVPRDPDDDFG